ncbi:hypothetical protein B5T_03939 [Alloalcanivorax dieselolei B5]|uniref:Uncharacterized protein n=1 Tax=Alcanivorax dieselolei (strain DSM 16502 / CGMCC 1.3690 / MCCC 1A00001 / B-5) TaxID=930169 RepID=K0CKU8_ALCDB|nr:hypothetical protein [Alloalcanivorax dieselolei]AFT72201.1 hypothetical protein B5T_03939 [Alloalcanivorax dieselolei B5]
MKKADPFTPVTMKAPGSNRARISHGLRWLNDRAWPLGSAILLLATFNLYSYISYEKIPLSLFSPGIISGLPILFIFQTLAIAGLFIVTMGPATIMAPELPPSRPISPRARNRFLIEYGDRRRPIRHAILSHIKKSPLLIVWGLSSLLSAFLWGLVLFALSALENDSPYGEIVVSLGFVLVLAVFTVMTLTRLQKLTGKKARDLLFSCFCSGLVQSLTFLIVTLFSINAARALDIPETHAAQLFVFVFLMLIALQILGAALADALLKDSNPIGLGTGSILGLVAVFSLFFQPAGALLTGYALQISSSGARPCAIVGWSTLPPGLEDISANPTTSIPLRILTEADSQYVVRPHGTNSKKTYFTPTNSVASIDDCPSKNPGKE